MPTMLHMWSTGQEIYELVDKADKDGGALGRELIFFCRFLGPIFFFFSKQCRVLT